MNDDDDDNNDKVPRPIDDQQESTVKIVEFEDGMGVARSTNDPYATGKFLLRGAPLSSCTKAIQRSQRTTALYSCTVDKVAQVVATAGLTATAACLIDQYQDHMAYMHCDYNASAALYQDYAPDDDEEDCDYNASAALYQDYVPDDDVPDDDEEDDDDYTPDNDAVIVQRITVLGSALQTMLMPWAFTDTLLTIPLPNWDFVETFFEEWHDGQSFATFVRDNAPRSQRGVQQHIRATQTTVMRVVNLLGGLADHLSHPCQGEIQNREFFYRYTEGLTQSQKERLLSITMGLLDVDKYQIRYYAIPRGIAIGDFQVTFEDESGSGESTVSGLTRDGIFMIDREIMNPNEATSPMNIIVDFANTIKSVVVVESKSIFNYLRQNGFHTRKSAIVVTGQGMPDKASRRFVARLVKMSYDQTGSYVRVFAVVDCNPCGWNILAAYERAIPCSIKWLGLLPTDIYYLREHAAVWLRGTALVKSDHRKLGKSTQAFICNADEQENTRRRRQIRSFRQRLMKKWNFEVVCNKQNIGLLLIERRMH
jgi:hypothetical protein